MSKSLKNFITIQQYLDWKLSDHPANDLRIFCLQYKYNSSLHFSKERIQEAINIRSKLDTYLSTISLAVEQITRRRCNESTVSNVRKSSVQSRELFNELFLVKNRIKECLENDFNTPEALKHILQLGNSAYQYASNIIVIASKSSDTMTTTMTDLSLEPLLAIAEYIVWICEIFGLDMNKHKCSHMFRNTSTLPVNHSNDDSVNKSIICALVEFREIVRLSCLKMAKLMKTVKKDLKKDLININHEDSFDEIKQNLVDVLRQCDKLRDEHAPKLGIRIDDIGEKSCWQLSRNVKDCISSDNNVDNLLIDDKPKSG